MKNSSKKDTVPVKARILPTSESQIYRSEDLFKNEREIVIIHGGAQYWLQITKAGKLILNK